MSAIINERADIIFNTFMDEKAIIPTIIAESSKLLLRITAVEEPLLAIFLIYLPASENIEKKKASKIKKKTPSVKVLEL